MPQLDALRALAFVAVAVSHWTPNFLAGIVPWGTGVQLFFVLSGFLITGILLRNRPGDSGNSLGGALKTFYARRILRIFPLYYGVLALALLFSLGPIHETWPWHAAYLSNFHYAWHGHGDAVADPFLHLWSLSVEEQFYFIWPLVALVASRRTLPVILVASIAGSAAFRVGIAHAAPDLASIRYLTPSCVDALAVGGLLAWVRESSGATGARRLAWTYLAVGFGGLVVATTLLPRAIDGNDAHRIGHTFLVIFYGAVVGGAAEGFRGPLGRLLSVKPLLYLGKISYGLYVYHYFAPIAIDRLARAWGWDGLRAQQASLLAAYSVFTLAAAAASWRFYERPINELKRHFPYRATVRTPRLPAASPSAAS